MHWSLYFIGPSLELQRKRDTELPVWGHGFASQFGTYDIVPSSGLREQQKRRVELSGVTTMQWNRVIMLDSPRCLHVPVLAAIMSSRGLVTFLYSLRVCGQRGLPLFNNLSQVKHCMQAKVHHLYSSEEDSHHSTVCPGYYYSGWQCLENMRKNRTKE